MNLIFETRNAAQFIYYDSKLLTYNRWENQLYLPYPVKMEYGEIFIIFGLKMMVKSGLEKIFLKFFHALAIFY